MCWPLRDNCQTSKGLEATYNLNAGRAQDLRTAKPLKLIDIPVDGAKQGKVNVSNTGEGILFARIIKKGQPLAGRETAAASGLQTTVNYTDREGGRIDPAKLSQGTDFFAEVSVFNLGTQGVY
jgi:hypothetical protein